MLILRHYLQSNGKSRYPGPLQISILYECAHTNWYQIDGHENLIANDQSNIELSPQGTRHRYKTLCPNGIG